jgi:hypothetical protein
LRVEFDRYSLRVDGERRLVRSGSLHYFRLPGAELWRDRLEKMRAAGLNAVDVYYPWSYHSEAPGAYDFAGLRDVERLHDLIEEAGLWLIARPGPYICAELDLGGLPAWLLRDRSCILRCRSEHGFAYSRAFLDASREWFSQIVPRFARRSNLLLVQVENEYTVPTPFGAARGDLADLLVRWFGARRASGWLASPLLRRLRRRRERRLVASGGLAGQTSPYMQDLCELARELGVAVPIFHNDLSSVSGRQMDVDMISVDRYPITRFDRDWRRDPASFDDFALDEAGLDAHGKHCPLFYPELQGGWYDGWGSAGYERVRAVLGPEAIDVTTKTALAERATLWNYYVFCGGTSWGYMSSPDVYSSYDYAAPIGESGRTGARYEAVRRTNAFLERYETELACTDRVEPLDRWCPEHLATRRGATRRFVFLRNASDERRALPMPESERSELAPWELQVRVYGPDRKLEAVSPPPPDAIERGPGLPPPLPRLERWTFSCASPQVLKDYDDADWQEISRDALERQAIDIDSLGLHYGFVWYRGTFHGTLDRLRLDARHSWAAWINGALVARGDQLRNPLGVGPDGARVAEVSLRGTRFADERNVLVVLVESLGHNKNFIDDGRLPRGIVRLDTGSTRVRWKFRGGLVRGERGMTPVVAFDDVERGSGEEVVLPHGWAGAPVGVGLYETRFALTGIDPKSTSLGLAFDPGRGKANLYLNGHLIGRYWPERGPQRRFPLPWGVLRPDGDNHLAVALWKRSERAALGKLRLEPL